MKYFVILFILLIPFTSFANLMISPTRINFDNRDRMQEVMIINSGNEERVYRIGWAEYRAKEVGGYIELESPDPNIPALSPHMRISPRQVRLAPGERQTIKLQLRKQADMPESEYRSHLLFTVLPPENTTTNQSDAEGIRMQINMFISYSIPVLYHPEIRDVDAQLKFHELSTRADESADLKIWIARKGDQSAFGRLEVFSVDDNKQIGIANNISVFRELTEAQHSVRLPNFSQYSGVEKVRLKYIGEKEHAGKTFIDEVIALR
ncbi:molecular chaperone [Glaciecola sp. SC05]|uniref:fimbrial biogenesis chaperone n=1 Tax=Glaciecola sp. SC05 TaxID=1987355 RepID=UPI0035286BAA